MSNQPELAGRVAIITGGTRGIGLATVKSFLNEGATVVLCGSRPESAAKAVAQIKEANPDAPVEGIAPNLQDYESVKAAFDAVAAKYGHIDILVNNAGVSESTPITSYTDEIMDKVINLNIKGIYHCTRAVVDQMIAQGKGVILNASSMVSICAQVTGVAYPTSKFAVNGFTLALARELGPKGIRVNAVAPGITNTDMVSSLPKEMMAPLIAAIPLGRLGEPEDVANAYTFLASDKASYISGVVLSVDGMTRV